MLACCGQSGNSSEENEDSSGDHKFKGHLRTVKMASHSGAPDMCIHPKKLSPESCSSVPQTWVYKAKTSTLQGGGKCLYVQGDRVKKGDCKKDDLRYRWDFEKCNSKHGCKGDIKTKLP